MAASLIDELAASRVGIVGKITLAEVLNLIRVSSWSIIKDSVRYTGEVIEVSTGQVRPAIYEGVTIYRYITSGRDEFNYPVEDAFYEDEARMILIAARHN